ncbi:HsdM family class I SAM-dependent methyltransferase [Bacillus subtilis]|uniref:HsdM family class I SAM-dependent methyltransferase n=1 Tax=Bacillus subtilis TaxID=1423 RepID=UPI00300E50EA
MLGNFYGEFVKYGGNDGNSLGIVLTPRHITSLMTELISVNKSDFVLDPACGTGAFLISAMNRMLEQAENEEERLDIKQNRLFGIEIQQKLFTIATTNMILRGDGKSNLIRDNSLTFDSNIMKKHGINKILMNPPYSQAKNDQTQHLSELSFIQHSLDMMIVGGKLCAIVPQSTMVGKTKHEKRSYWKIILLKQ